MRAVGRLLPLLAFLTVACGPATLPPVAIPSSLPARMRADQAVTVTVTLEGLFPFFVDYASAPHVAETRTMALFLGPTPLGTFRVGPDGTALVQITSLLTPGSYDLQAILSD